MLARTVQTPPRRGSAWSSWKSLHPARKLRSRFRYDPARERVRGRASAKGKMACVLHLTDYGDGQGGAEASSMTRAGTVFVQKASSDNDSRERASMRFVSSARVSSARALRLPHHKSVGCRLLSHPVRRNMPGGYDHPGPLTTSSFPVRVRARLAIDASGG